MTLKKLREAMGHKDSVYLLKGVIEVDDALIGEKWSGKRGRRAAGKTPVLIACENKKIRRVYCDESDG
ncbi:MAG: hypothetical protein L3J84_03850 [Gammaproteobacteria bacterium]|nr:hypothetical protein [Gammaproteobacteria bacterium]